MENRIMFYKSNHVITDMKSITNPYNHNKTIRNISLNSNRINKKFIRFSYLSRERLSFREIQNPKKRQQLASTLNFIFLPPGFSYLFSYYDTFTCKLTEDLSKLIPRYSYTKKAAKERYNMDPDDEEIEFGYISSKKE